MLGTVARDRGFYTAFVLSQMSRASYEGLDVVRQEAKCTKTDACMYEFSRNWRSVHSTFVHFQVRTLIQTHRH
jgi:hypothetical protein